MENKFTKIIGNGRAPSKGRPVYIEVTKNDDWVGIMVAR